MDLLPQRREAERRRHGVLSLPPGETGLKRVMRFALGFLAVGALVGATVAGGSALARALSVRMAELKVQGMAALEQLLGRHGGDRSISPSTLRQIRIPDLL